MKVIGMLSRKGGSGKTTLAVHLAVLAQPAGRPPGAAGRTDGR
jgi:cellulose biosynthesis protein BcsQ